jgi:membrane protein
MSIKAIWDFVKETLEDWSEDRASRLAAALAYYTIFSLAPLLIIAIAIAGLVFGREATQGQIVTQISGLVGWEAAKGIQTLIENASKRGSGSIATAFGIIVLLIGASGFFGQLQDGLNTIWEVKPRPGRGLLGIVKDRFLSFTMVLGVGFLLLVSLIISAGLAALGEFLGQFMPGTVIVGHLLNVIISLLVITLFFAMIFKILPDVKISWRDVWIGAAVTAFLFTTGKLLLGVYLAKSNIASAYGAAGALVVILVWVYYSAMILFLGAEFTQVYANRYGSHIVPARDAVPVTEEARAQQGITEQKPSRGGICP